MTAAEFRALQAKKPAKARNIPPVARTPPEPTPDPPEANQAPVSPETARPGRLTAYLSGHRWPGHTARVVLDRFPADDWPALLALLHTRWPELIAHPNE
ncbi:hypothetical protein GCM10027048_27890 [Hymenobacter coalescens]